MFITVTGGEEKRFITTNKSRKLEMCGCKYFRVHVRIIALTSQQIPGLYTTFNLNIQDLPRQKSFSRTIQVLKILPKKFQDFPGGVRALTKVS